MTSTIPGIRELEVSALIESLARDTGGLCLVLGEPRVGKSHLVREAIDRVPDLHGAWVGPGLGSGFGDASAIADLAASLNLRLPSEHHERVRVLLAALATRDPYRCLVIEDAHLLDPVSQEVLWSLLRAGAEMPLRVVVVDSQEEHWFVQAVSRLIDTSSSARLIRVLPFDDAEISDVVWQELGLRLPSDAVRGLHEATGGSPSQLFQLLHLFATARAVSVNDAVERLAAEVASQPGLQRKVEQILQGGSDGLGAALAVLALTKGLAHAALAQVLTQAGLAVPTPQALRATGLVLDLSGGRLGLRDAGTTRLILEWSGAARLRGLRRLLGEILPGLPGLAHRVELASPGRIGPDGVAEDDPTLVPELLREVESRVFAHDERGQAEALRLLAELDPGLGADFAIFCLATSREDLLDDATPAILRHGPSLVGRMLTALHEARIDGLEPSELTLRGLLGRDLTLREALLLGMITTQVVALRTVTGELWGLSLAADVAEALRRWHRAHPDRPEDAALREGIEANWLVLDCFASLHQEVQGSFDAPEALRTFEARARLLAERPGTETPLLLISAVQAELLRLLGRAEESLGLLTALRDTGLHLPTLVLSECLTSAWIRFEAGAWDHVEQEADRLYATLLGSRTDGGSPELVAVSALVPGARGRTRLAAERAARARSLRPGGTKTLAHVFTAMAKMWEDVANGGDAAAVADSLTHWWERLGYGTFFGVTSLVLRVRADLACGRQGDVALCLGRLDSTPASGRTPRWRAAAAHIDALARTRSDDVASTAEAWERAWAELDAQALAEPSAPLALFRAVLAEDEAAWHRRTRVPVDATSRRRWEEARAVLVHAGAKPWLARLESAFAATVATVEGTEAQDAEDTLMFGRAAALPAERVGSFPPPGRPWNPASTRTAAAAVVPVAPVAPEGWPQLTEREREIAHLVSLGQTNREIAGELVLSVRTVEFHVGNALTKLNCADRVQLRRLLTASGAG